MVDCIPLYYNYDSKLFESTSLDLLYSIRPLLLSVTINEHGQAPMTTVFRLLKSQTVSSLYCVCDQLSYSTTTLTVWGIVRASVYHWIANLKKSLRLRVSNVKYNSIKNYFLRSQCLFLQIGVRAWPLLYVSKWPWQTLSLYLRELSHPKSSLYPIIHNS